MRFEIHHYHHFPDSEASVVLAKLEEIRKQGIQIMSSISEFAGKVNAAFEGISTAVDGVKADVEGLKAKIQELQDSAGQISPEDQALLDDIQAKAESAATKLAELDAATENAPTP